MQDRSNSRSNSMPLVLAVATVIASLALTAAAAQQAAPSEEGGGHFAAPTPADLTPGEAAAIYRDIREQMLAGYRLSDNSAAQNFARWQRFNTAPYRSATHGERYVNNYANALAEAYGEYEAAGAMPPGAVVVKDTFYVSQSGGVFPGALMIMEKMAAGFSDVTGDWRYSMIMPDGSLYGTTGGESAQSVRFCAECHALTAETDYLFFLPESYRIATE